MKKKIISVLLACFLIVSTTVSSFAYEKQSRLVSALTPQMLGVITTIAVGSGIIINNAEDIIDLGRGFYEYHKNQWEVVGLAFDGALSMMTDGKINCRADVVNYVKEFLVETFSDDNFSAGKVYLYSSLNDLHNIKYDDLAWGNYKNGVASGGHMVQFSSGDFVFVYKDDGSVYAPSKGQVSYYFKLNGPSGGGVLTSGGAPSYGTLKVYGNVLKFVGEYGLSAGCDLTRYMTGYNDGIVSIPYTGGFSWDKLGQKEENGDLPLYIPQDLSSLLGGTSTDVLNGNYDLVTDGTISFPNVSNPSISIEGSTTIEGAGTTDKPDVDTGTGNPIIPSFPSFGDSINFEPLYATGITEKFPFSLPWDIQRLIGVFNVKEVAPKFTVPLLSEKIELDLTKFNELAAIVRFFVLISFIICLVFISTRLIG